MEEWRPLQETDLYEASSYGYIRNVKTGRILYGTETRRGRIRVTISINGKPCVRYMHRLIAEAFYGSQCNNLDVYHKDGNVKNNRLDNLCIGTRGDSIRNYYSNCDLKRTLGKRILVVETGEVFNTISECSEVTGMSRSTISKCLNYDFYNNVKGLHFKLIN